MKRFIVNNKKIASIALSSAMVLSNAQFGTQIVLADEVIETKAEEKKEDGDLEEITEATDATDAEVVETADEVAVEATEVVKATPVKSVRAAEEFTYQTIASSANALTVTENVDGTISVVDTDANGKFYASSGDQALSNVYDSTTQSYLLFPSMPEGGKISTTFKVNALPTASNARGIVLGTFSNNPIDGFAGMAIRGKDTGNVRFLYRKPDPNATSQSWSASNPAGALSEIKTGDTVTMTFEKTATTITSTITVNGVTTEKAYTTPETFYPNIFATDKSQRLGLAIGDSDITISDLVVKDVNDVEKYNLKGDSGEVTAPTYTGFTKTENANGSVTFTVTGTNLVLDDLSVKETATGGHSKDITGFTGTATQATLTVTPTANTTVEAGITYTYTLFDKTTQATGTNVNPLTVNVAYTAPEEDFNYETIASSANGLTVTENEDGTISMVDTDANGKFYASSGDQALSNVYDSTTQSYVLFPSMPEGGEITTTFKVNSLPTASNARGLAIGSFANDPIDGFTAMAIRGKDTGNVRVLYRKPDPNATSQSWSASNPAGALTDIKAGDTVTVNFKKSAASFDMSIAVNGVITEKSYIDPALFHPNAFNTNVSQRLGFALADTNITVSDLVVKDKDGIEKYNLKADGGEVTPPTFTSFTKTEEADGDITFKVVGTDLVADDLSIKETATGHDIKFEGFETNSTNTEATLRITPSANTTVVDGITYTYTLFEGSEAAKDTTGTAIAPLTALVPYEEAAADFVKTGELDVTAYGQQLTLSNKNAAASLTSLANTGYYLLPATTDNYTITCDVEYAVGAATNNNGMLLGLVDDTATPPYVSTLGIRSTNGLRGLYTKGDPYAVGAGAINTTFDNTKPVSLKIERNADGLYQEAIDADGNISKSSIAYGSVKNGSNQVMFADSSLKYGFVIANADVKIRNLLVVDADGDVVYDQNEMYVADGNAPVVGTVTATKGTDDVDVKVDWTATTEGVGDGAYKVEYKKDDGEWTTLIKRTTEKTFTHDIVKLGKGTYTYRVTGYVGNTETASVLSTPVVANPPFAASTLATIVAGDKSAVLTWSANDNATSYEVYRRSADEANFTLLTTVNAPTVTYTDTTVTNEMPYYYKIVGKSADNKSLDSNVMFTLPTAGHSGEYVYESEATKIAITSKSSDTVVDGKASLAGTVDKAGTLDLMVNGTKVDSKTLAASDAFSFTDFDLVDGRNDVNLIFTDSEGKKTRKTFNFVNLVNYDYVVDAAYTGTAGALDTTGHKQYKTIQAATDAAGANNPYRVVIYVKNGSYDEYLRVTSPNVSLIGEDRDGVVIHNIAVMGISTESRSATIIKESAENFTAENLTFKHDHVYTGTGSAEQADAIRTEADNSVFVNVKLSSFQDTLQTQKGDVLFYKCYIEGLVDFIYGGDGEALFEDCDIVYRAHDVKQEGHIAAPKHEGASVTYGYIFNNSRLLAEDAINGYANKTKYDLVRPWGKGAKVAFVNTYMTEVLGLAANGGHSNGLGVDPMSVTLVEYNSYGPGFVQTDVRKQISQAQATTLLATAKTSFDSEAAAKNLSDAYVKSQVPVEEATVTAISPTSKTFTYKGGNERVTITGTNLTEDNIKLTTTSDATVSLVSVSPSRAVFNVVVPENTSNTDANVYTFTAELDGVKTNYTSKFTVSKTPSSNNGGGSSSSGGGSSVVKKPVNNTTIGTGDDTSTGGVSNKPTTYTDKGVTVEVSQSLANKENVSIDVKPATVSDDVKASLVETNAINETLLGESKTVSVIDNGTNVTKVNDAIKVSFDVSGIDLADSDKDKLVAVCIDEATGEITYLGGKLIDGTFVTETSKIDGDFAVIVADPKDFSQATFTVNSTDLETNSGSVKLDAAPVIQNNTTFVPVRAISESLGADVTYDAPSKTASISLNGKTTKFTTGVSKDGSPAPIIVNNRMLIPLRFVSESLDANVIWYAADKTIQVTK